MKFIGYIFLLISVTFASCKTNLVYIHSTNPAPVTLNKAIKKVGIISRTTPSEENKTLNTLHQILSTETLKLIKESSSEAMRGLSDALIHYNRFDTIKAISGEELNTPVTGTFPTQLSWPQVESICKSHEVDLLFVLEVFSSELKVVPLNMPPPGLNSMVDILNAATQARVNIITTVKVGWRVYDPHNLIILDEYPMSENLIVTAGAVNIINTTEAMLGRKEAIKQSSYKMGSSYADRIIPYAITLTRDYYVKGTSNFKIATRRARTGNWDGAGELWLKDTKSTKRKIAGRAHYNMAILNEINGDLETAISWAQKAYEDYNDKLALKYINLLKDRKGIYSGGK
ncbi:MAG: hypothetical protein K0S26_1484 [Bacteroidota bacterium]|jgi:hypothetical protein|nr:hypothetical protein [Bacteroidota bacterium]